LISFAIILFFLSLSQLQKAKKPRIEHQKLKI